MKGPVLKHAVERLIIGAGLPRLLRRVRGPRDVILAYHNIVPHGATHGGERSLHLPQARFAAQLEHLASRFRIVPLGEILDGAEDGRPRLAITFDDAYRGAVHAGVSELGRAGLPATLFASPGLLGGGPFWWDVLSEGFSGAIPDRVRRHAMTDLKGDRESVLSWATSEGFPRAREIPDCCTVASVEELASAARVAGITVGSHGWSHRNLAALPPGELDDELALSRTWIEERIGSAVPFISYPYGLYSGLVEASTIAHGYARGLAVSGGPLGRGPLPFSLPRVNIPRDVSADGLLLRAEGIVRA